LIAVLHKHTKKLISNALPSTIESAACYFSPNVSTHENFQGSRSVTFHAAAAAATDNWFVNSPHLIKLWNNSQSYHPHHSHKGTFPAGEYVNTHWYGYIWQSQQHSTFFFLSTSFPTSSWSRITRLRGN
jgi:hypothetical protein